METQVENAIQIAWNPHSEIGLKQQAIEFVHQLRSDPQSWTVCLPLAIRRPPAAEIVQHTAIDVVLNAIQGHKLTPQELLTIRNGMTTYVQQTYGTHHSGPPDPANILNKFAEGFTNLFTKLYISEWTTFFADLLVLTAVDTAGTSNTNSVQGTKFYLKVINSIHDEIADVLLAKTPEEQLRDTTLKDLVRQRDIQKIAATWHNILSQFNGKDAGIMGLCLATIGAWASWIDLSLIVNETFLNLLFTCVMNGVSHPDGDAAMLRDSALGTYIEILGKKMRAADKLSLIDALKVGEVVASLTGSSLLLDAQFTSAYDTDFAEIVAKLINGTVLDIVIILRDNQGNNDIIARADQHLKAFIPYTLRFFSDEYDEVCSAMIPCLTEMLTFFRKKAGDNVVYKLMLPSILQAIMNKMKYDEGSQWVSEDNQTDEAEFQELRKRLQNLQQAVAAVDETLYIDTVSEMTATVFDTFQANKSQVHWRDVDLALYEMYLFGQLAVKNGNIYSKSKPISPAAERLVVMITKMINSDIASHPHPSIHLQFMEICVRYVSFFEVNSDAIAPVLEKFILFVHHGHPKVRQRSWYLLFRFIKQLRSHIGNNGESVIRAVSDILPIRAELPEDEADDDDMSSDENDQSADARFQSQLYLYEAVGNICGLPQMPQESQVFHVRSVMAPLFDDLQRHLPAASARDARATLQIHHIIMALGTLAHGFSEWVPNNPAKSTAPAKEVAEEFAKAAEAILLALETLSSSLDIRTAARAAFSRMVGVLRNGILPQLPRWIQGLLSQASSKDEIAMFLRVLDQVVFAFKTEIFDILNSLLTPFLQRVFQSMQEPVTGTDDRIQLAELKEQYLTFILAVLSNDQAGVFVSNQNQPIFETLISTLEHFTGDASDLSSAKLAFPTLSTMVNTWGGPNVVKADGTPTGLASQPGLPGFDSFMIQRFSKLVWALPGNTAFNPQDAQAKQVLGEAAGLQVAIYTKTGTSYLSYLEQSELKGLGLDAQGIKEYLENLATADSKRFKRYFQTLIRKLR